jgi:hypothetical protein
MARDASTDSRSERDKDRGGADPLNSLILLLS